MYLLTGEGNYVQSFTFYFPTFVEAIFPLEKQNKYPKVKCLAISVDFTLENFEQSKININKRNYNFEVSSFH